MIVRDRRTGQFLTLARDPYTGKMVPIDPRLAEPGSMDLREEQELWDSLPAADVRGYAEGMPGIVPGGEPAIRRPEAPVGPQHIPTFRPLGGAQQGNRGNQVQIDTTQTLQRVPVLQTERSNGDDAENIVVVTDLTFDGIDAMGGVNPGGRWGMQMEITWGIGGANFNARVDWLPGGVFSICASFLSITALWFKVAGEVIAQPIARASAAFGYGGNSQRSQTSRLTDFGRLPALAAGASGDIAIPRYAVAFTPLVPDGSDLTFDMNSSIIASPGLSFGQYRYNSITNQANQAENLFPLPTGRAHILRTTNNALVALPADGITMLWMMSLGS
jgi:hypothetical protein